MRNFIDKMLKFIDKLVTNIKERPLKQRLLIVLPLVLVLLLATWFWLRTPSSTAFFLTTAVTQGDLLATISATGTVEPEEVVDIGAQVAGRIVTFGKDKDGGTVDYGSRVEKGTVLAKIDDAIYAAEVSQAKAALAQAKANVKRSEADLGQMKAKLFQAERDWGRAKKLGPSDALSQSDYDAALSAFEVAKANLNVGQAAVVQAKDAVAQAEATLRRASQNLDYCTIRSPVRGVIIDRRVNIGQTVVASLNAPSLFLIAKDLTRMEVWAAVNEADIGNIRPGQPVSFTVDAFPGVAFQGEVAKTRLNATMTQNVVTYTVEVDTDNSDGRLIPYLTANLKFLVAERKNVLLAPNAALRWLPQSDQIATGFQEQPNKRKGGKSKEKKESTADGKGAGRTGTLWIPQGSYVRPVMVSLGLSDGSLTEVQGPELQEGMRVVVAEQQKGVGTADGSASPFVPQPLRGRSSPPPPPH